MLYSVLVLSAVIAWREKAIADLTRSSRFGAFGPGGYGLRKVFIRKVLLDSQCLERGLIYINEITNIYAGIRYSELKQ